MATPAQKEYIEKLMAKLGYDEQDINIDQLSVPEASKLIDDLKKELYG
jgi:hypothetical protein